jgi:hypothetical protein
MDASRFPATMWLPTKDGRIALELLAIDLDKRSFHLYGIDTCDPVAEGQSDQAGRGAGRVRSEDNRNGSMRRRALLGAMLARRWPPSAAHFVSPS